MLGWLIRNIQFLNLHCLFQVTVLDFFFLLVKSKITKQATLKEDSSQHMNPSLYLGLNGTVLLSTLKPFTDSLQPAWQIQVPWPLPVSLPSSLACLQHFSPRGWPERGSPESPDWWTPSWFSLCCFSWRASQISPPPPDQRLVFSF